MVSMSASLAGASRRSDPGRLRQSFFERLKFLVHAVELLRGVGEFLLGVGDMAAHGLEILVELLQVTVEASQLGKDLAGLALDLQAPEPEGESHEVGVKGIGRHREDVLAGGVGV